MKRLLPFVTAFCCASHLLAQSIAAPHPPALSVINAPGATLAQVIDTMRANANQADTAEGGALDNITTFHQLWQGRVSANPSSGSNMSLLVEASASSPNVEASRFRSYASITKSIKPCVPPQ
jgi:hypothetical protein